MGSGNYISLLNSNGASGTFALFSPSKGGETAGSVAFSHLSQKSSTKNIGGETAGSVAFSGSISSCGSNSCSFSAIA